LGGRIAESADVPVYRSRLVVEGGGFLSDGEGTLITAETCVLNPNRNPGGPIAGGGGASRHARNPKSDLAAGDVMDTETDGQSTLFAYVKPATVLLEVVADPRIRGIRSWQKIAGRWNGRLTHADVASSCCPSPRRRAPQCRTDKTAFALLCNFYISNGAIIAPPTGSPRMPQ